MSRSGVPSSTSSPDVYKILFSRFNRRTTLSPIGLGRTGERVANRPASVPCGAHGGVTDIDTGRVTRSI